MNTYRLSLAKFYPTKWHFSVMAINNFLELTKEFSCRKCYAGEKLQELKNETGWYAAGERVVLGHFIRTQKHVCEGKEL